MASAISAVQEDTIPGGGVKVTIRNTSPSWSRRDLMMVCFWLSIAYTATLYLQRGLLAYYTPHTSYRMSMPIVVALSLCLFLASKLTRIESESATVLPGVGVQLSTNRGFRIGSKMIQSSTSHHLVPRDRILDLYVSEGFKFFSVVDHLVLVTATGDPQSQRGAKLHPVFPNLFPRLPVVTQAYRTLYPVLFDSHPLQSK